jgi:outer membrane lipoprotein SlyB
MDEDVQRAMRQYEGWSVVAVLDVRTDDGQYILKIQSPDGNETTFVTSNVALVGLDGDEDEDEEGGR